MVVEKRYSSDPNTPLRAMSYLIAITMAIVLSSAMVMADTTYYNCGADSCQHCDEFGCITIYDGNITYRETGYGAVDVSSYYPDQDWLTYRSSSQLDIGNRTGSVDIYRIYAWIPKLSGVDGRFDTASNITSASYCFPIVGGQKYGFSSNFKAYAHEVYNLTYAMTYNMTWNTQRCGTVINESSFCNMTKELPYTPITGNTISFNQQICFDVTKFAQRQISQNTSSGIMFAPYEIQYQYLYAWLSSAYTTGHELLYNQGYPELYIFYNSTNATILNFTSFSNATTTTTTADPTAGTISADYLNNLAGFFGEMFGTTAENGKVVVWITFELIVIYLLLTKSNGLIDWRLGAFIFAVLLLVGSVLGFMPVWIAVVFVILAVAVVVFWASKVVS